MRRFCPLFLAAATLLFISACSTPEDLHTPTLEPQFGSADDDIGVDVALSTGSIYSLAEQFVDASYRMVLLRRYDNGGNLTWTKEVAFGQCHDFGCNFVHARTLQSDAQGFTYALVSKDFPSVGDCADSVRSSVHKFDAAGNQVAEFYIGSNGESYGGNAGPAFVDAVDIAVDGVGNIYVARQSAEFSDDFCGATRSNVVAKYSAIGLLQWQRASTVGTPKDITVSGSGSVYVAGSTGIARYSNSGGLTWTKSGGAENIIVSGSNLYTRYRKDIRKYDGTGKQLWLRSQIGLSTMVFQDMTGDGSGNVYLSGKYDAGSGNFNAMTRKLNSSGTVLWTKTYGTSAYDDARGIATISGSEVYVTGETQGSLAHTNRGGPENRDGYLRKLSSSGSPVWTR